MDPALGSIPPGFSHLPTLQMAPCAAALLRGAQHRIVWFNDACQTMFGQGLQVGSDLFDCVIALEHSALKQNIDNALSTGKTLRFVSPVGADLHSSSNALQRELDVTVTAYSASDKTDAGVFFLAVERLASSKGAPETKPQGTSLQALIESLPHAVFLSDEQGRALFANQRWQQYTGCTPSAMTKDEWYQRVHPEDIDVMRYQWERRLELGRFEMCVRILEQSSGQYRWQHIVGLPCAHDSGSPVHWIGTWTDLTKRVQSEEHQNELRLRFVSTISHDLRGPLTAIRTSAQSMSRQCKEPSFQNKLERMVRTVDSHQ